MQKASLVSEPYHSLCSCACPSYRLWLDQGVVIVPYTPTENACLRKTS
jgi:hypothetical protein